MIFVFNWLLINWPISKNFCKLIPLSYQLIYYLAKQYYIFLNSALNCTTHQQIYSRDRGSIDAIQYSKKSTQNKKILLQLDIAILTHFQ